MVCKTAMSIVWWKNNIIKIYDKLVIFSKGNKPQNSLFPSLSLKITTSLFICKNIQLSHFATLQKWVRQREKERVFVLLISGSVALEEPDGWPFIEEFLPSCTYWTEGLYGLLGTQSVNTNSVAQKDVSDKTTHRREATTYLKCLPHIFISWSTAVYARLWMKKEGWVHLFKLRSKRYMAWCNRKLSRCRSCGQVKSSFTELKCSITWKTSL